MVRFPPWGLEMERELFSGRLEAARAFAAANRINRIAVSTPQAWLGIAAAGKTYHDVREALRALGLDDDALRRHGIRLLHVRMPFPLPPGLVREFARGLEELLVIEEKRSFVELQMREILFDEARHPRVTGKQDEQGRVLVPAYGELDADGIALILARRLERRISLPSITARAALLDGRHVRGLDQTGLSQKGGPVVSHLKISEAPPDFSNKVGMRGADCYLGLDVLVATASTNLDRAAPERTVAVLSTSAVPTGPMVTSPDARFPDRGDLLTAVNRVTRKDDNVVLDAVGLAEALFDDNLMANPIMLGAAYQAGAIPVSAASIEAAIALNGVAVEANTQAFRAGRRAVADPSWAATLPHPRLGEVPLAPALTDDALRLVEASGATGELRRLLALRVPELIAYQDVPHAAVGSRAQQPAGR